MVIQSKFQETVLLGRIGHMPQVNIYAMCWFNIQIIKYSNYGCPNADTCILEYKTYHSELFPI